MAKRVSETKKQAQAEWKDVVGCMSCGLPVDSRARKAVTEVGEVCPHCVDRSGHLKSYEEVHERLVAEHFMKGMKMSRPDAEKAATEHLKKIPAWSG